MTTPRTRPLVSLAETLTVTIVLAACGAPSRQGLDERTTSESRPLSIRFDNDAREHVHVYLIAEHREWLLGRVEPGAVATLRFPEAALAGRSRFVRLAVITGKRLTQQAALDPAATFTVPQPASVMLLEQWKFAQGQISAAYPRRPLPAR